MVLKLMLTEEHSFLDGRALSLFGVWQPWCLTQEGEVHQRPDFQLISLYAFQITLEMLAAVTQPNYSLTGSIFLRERKVCNLWSKSMALNWGSLYFLVMWALRYVMSSHLSINCSIFFLYFFLVYSEPLGLKAVEKFADVWMFSVRLVNH